MLNLSEILLPFMARGFFVSLRKFVPGETKNAPQGSHCGGVENVT
nr:hypothetical protein [uncultured Anaerostipes sp.]